MSPFGTLLAISSSVAAVGTTTSMLGGGRYLLSPRVEGGESEAELIWVRLGQGEFEDTNGTAVWITEDLEVLDNGHDDKGC